MSDEVVYAVHVGEDLESALALVAKLREEREDFQQRLTAAEARNVELEEENGDLQKRIRFLEDKLSELDEETTTTIEQLQAELQSRQAEMSQMVSYDEWASFREAVTNEIKQRLQDDMSRLQEERDSYRQAYADVRDELEHLRADFENAAGAQQGYEIAVQAETDRKLTEYEAMIEALKAKLGCVEQDRSKRDTQFKNVQLEARVSSLKQEVEGLRTSKQELHAKLNQNILELQTELDEEIAQKNSLSEQCLKLKAETEELRSELDILRTKAKDDADDNWRQQRQLSDQLHDAEEQIKRLQAELDEQQTLHLQKLSESQRIRQQLQDDLDQSTAQLDAAERALKENTERMKEQELRMVQEAQQQKLDTTAALHDKDATIDRLQNQLAEAQRQSESQKWSLTKQIDESHESLARLRNEAEALRTEKQHAVDELARLKLEVTELPKLREETGQLRNDLSLAKQRHEDADQRARSAQLELEQSRLRYKALQDELSSTKRSLQDQLGIVARYDETKARDMDGVRQQLEARLKEKQDELQGLWDRFQRLSETAVAQRDSLTRELHDLHAVLEQERKRGQQAQAQANSWKLRFDDLRRRVVQFKVAVDSDQVLAPSPRSQSPLSHRTHAHVAAHHHHAVST